MNRCCIIECESNKLSLDKKIFYFKFPFEDKNLLQKWITQIGKKDWMPKEDDKLCAMHFSSLEIETLAGSDPKLKAGAVPMIFPSYKVIPGLQTPLVNQTNTNMKLISFQGTAPVILTPQLVKQLPGIISGQRYRKILPKVDQSAELPNQIPVSIQSTPNVTNPCLILIPFDNNTPVANNSPVVANNVASNIIEPDKKKLTLRIQVDRHYTKEQYLSEFLQDKSKSGAKNEETDQEEVVIDNVALNRRVTFSLDPITGELKVSKCAISSEAEEEPNESLKNENTKISNDEIKLTTLNNESKTVPENTHVINGLKPVINDKPLSLKDLKKISNKSSQNTSSQKPITTEADLQKRYTEAQKNFNMLRRRVRILRQTRKREIDQVEKLQSQLDHLKSDTSRAPDTNNEELDNKRLKSLPENESMLNNEVLIIKLPHQPPQTSTDEAISRSNKPIVKCNNNNVSRRKTNPGILNNREAAEKTICHEFMKTN
ncbi:GSCOCG00008436001-RA-CDS [Cotesia congregata]|nr:GSCOCG00008436001-RA-CDS [Cotesia congregata]